MHLNKLTGMPNKAASFIGIDVGTQGCRTVLVSENGTIFSAQECAFPLSAASREEQSPAAWWEACLATLRQLVHQARNVTDLSTIRALTVTSTSGTVIPLDEACNPLHNALMYSDKRSSEEAEICASIALEYDPEGFTAFNSSCGLPKMLWFVRNFPGKAKRIARWVHAGDYILGRLSKDWTRSDFTNVLKSGYDLEKEVWPAYIYQKLPLKREWLPQAVASGTPRGAIRPDLAKQLGLPGGITVTAGMTDGCASQVASGAVELGTWNTTIGTTLVVKGVTREPLADPEGRFYSHCHPDGFWMPGGASNTGADWVEEFKEPGGLQSLEKQAVQLLPGRHIAYPLRQEGERFPFIAPQARGFGPGMQARPGTHSRAETFLANLEGVACLERYAFELVEALSGEKVEAIYSAGGGSASDIWLRIRSNLLNKPIFVMEHVSGAMGAAILAASRTHFGSVRAAAKAMTRISREIRPEPALAAAYQSTYRRFIQVMKEKKYIK